MSSFSAKRWGRWFALLWVGMWLSTALLPCREVLAAAAQTEQAFRSGCGHPADQAPDPARGRKGGACVGVAAPVRAPVQTLAAEVAGKTMHQPAAASAPIHVLSLRPVRSLRSARPLAAPPPASFHRRSSRLLI